MKRTKKVDSVEESIKLIKESRLRRLKELQKLQKMEETSEMKEYRRERFYRWMGKKIKDHHKTSEGDYFELVKYVYEEPHQEQESQNNIFQTKKTLNKSLKGSKAKGFKSLYQRLTKKKKKIKIKNQAPKIKKKVQRIPLVADINEKSESKPYHQGINYLCGNGPGELARVALNHRAKYRGKNDAHVKLQRQRELDYINSFKSESQRNFEQLQVMENMEVQRANLFTKKEQKLDILAKKKYARIGNKKYWMRKLQFESEAFSDSVIKPRKLPLKLFDEKRVDNKARTITFPKKAGRKDSFFDQGVDSDSEIGELYETQSNISLSRDTLSLNLNNSRSGSNFEEDIPVGKVHFGFESMFKNSNNEEKEIASQTTAPLQVFAKKNIHIFKSKNSLNEKKRDSFFEAMFSDDSLSKSEKAKFKFF